MSRSARRTARKKAQDLLQNEQGECRKDALALHSVPTRQRKRKLEEEDSWTSSGSPQEEDCGTVRNVGSRKMARRCDSPDSSDRSGSEEDDGLCEYERKRIRNIQENMALLASLNLFKTKQEFAIIRGQGKPKREKKEREPQQVVASRRSLRIQGVTPEGKPVPPSSEPLRQEHQVQMRPARKPSGSLEMRCCFTQISQAQEEMFRGDLLQQMSSLNNVPTGDSSSHRIDAGDVDRIAVLSKLHLRHVTKVTRKRIYSFEFHPMSDKTIVAAGDCYGHLGIWAEGCSGQDQVVMYEPHSQVIPSLVFPKVPSTPMLYTCSYDGTVRAADFERGIFQEVYATTEDADLCLTSCDLSSDSHWLIVGCGNGTVVQLDCRESKKPVRVWECHDKWIKTVHLNPADNNYFVSASNDGSAAIWDLRKINGCKSCVQRIPYSRSVSSAYFSPVSGKKLLLTCMENCISVLESTRCVGSAMVPLVRLRHNNQTGRWLTPFRARWDPSSDDHFVVGSMEHPRQVQVYTVSSSSRCPSLVLRDDLLNSVCSLTAIHPRKTVLGGANASGKVYLWS